MINQIDDINSFKNIDKRVKMLKFPAKMAVTKQNNNRCYGLFGC